MSSNPSLINLPIYHEFVERYQNNLEGFCFDVCGLALTQDQQDLARAMEYPRARVSVVSGTGTGKTAIVACICLWHLICFPVARYDGKEEIGSNTFVGAAALKQVADGIWKEMNDRLAFMKTIPYLKWLTAYIVNLTESWYIKGYKETWFIRKIALGNSDSVAIAGKHRYYQLIIVDEATGVSDNHFDVIKGTQTQGGNRTLLLSQGTKTVGFFYRTHHELSQLNTPFKDGGWVNLRFNSENAPHVSLDWIKERLIECGGRDSVEYRIRVLGEFAEDDEKTLINRLMINRAMRRNEPIIKDSEPYGWFLLCDVAMGEYRDYSVCVLAKVIGVGNNSSRDDNEQAKPTDARRVEFKSLLVYSNSIDMRQFRGRIVEEYQKFSNARVLVDAGGNGLQLCKDLEDEGVDVHRISWGNPCFNSENKKRFINLRAQAMVGLRDAIRDGRCLLPNVEGRVKETMINQATHLPYSFTEKTQFQMMSKQKMREQGISSPDIMDAFSFAFLERIHYNVSDKAGVFGNKQEKRLSMREKMKAKMAAQMNAN